MAEENKKKNLHAVKDADYSKHQSDPNAPVVDPEFAADVEVTEADKVTGPGVEYAKKLGK